MEKVGVRRSEQVLRERAHRLASAQHRSRAAMSDREQRLLEVVPEPLAQQLSAGEQVVGVCEVLRRQVDDAEGHER
jgi:hypothetical protein